MIRAPAFRHTDFRWFWSGQLVSQTGTWMQTVALGWLVYRLSGSALTLGLVTLLSALPAGLTVVWGGVLADRYSRRGIILAAQTLAMAQAFTLAVLVASGAAQLWHVVVLALVYGLASGLDEGARQSILAEVVAPDDLVNASDLIVTARMMARALGPLAAGVALSAYGEAFCFALNGLSFAAMLVAALVLRTPWRVPPDEAAGKESGSALGEVLRFALTPAGVTPVIALVALDNFFLLALVPLLPAFVVGVLGADAPTLGWLNGAFGLGALAGAALIAVAGARAPRTLAFALATLAAPLAGAALGGSRWLWLAAAALVALGALTIGQTALGNGLLQVQSPPHMRSRIMSLNALFTYGATRVGTLALGAGADWLGLPLAVGAGALLCLVLSAPILLLMRSRGQSDSRAA